MARTGFKLMRTICKGCGKKVFVDYWMVEYKRCQDCCIKSDYVCNCDCECSKENDRPDNQCDDCDNGTHYDNIRKIYVNYEEDEN